MNQTPTPPHNLSSDLTAGPHGFELFQAISLLERAHPTHLQVATGVGLDEAVRLVGDVGLAFAPSDIAAIRPSKRAGPPLTLSSSVMTLAGISGPLPLPLTEWLLERRREHDVAALDFLDIFNQRLLGLLYRNRVKHHPSLGSGALSASPVVQVLRGLSGSAGSRTKPENTAGSWLRHAALQCAAPRSMASLLAVLADRTGIAFSGRQMVGGWLDLSVGDRASLGRRTSAGLRAARLGVNAHLGARAWDQSSGIEICATAHTAAEFCRLLPGGQTHGEIRRTVHDHLQAHLDLRLRLIWDTGRKEGVTLPRFGLAGGQRQTGTPHDEKLMGPRLGQTSWLMGSTNAPGLAAQPRLSSKARLADAVIQARGTELTERWQTGLNGSDHGH